MRATTMSRHERERGSAMVIAVLVMVILTLLGVSFLLMADTENRIAENERLSFQALYFAESGVRQIKRWFDRPPDDPAGTAAWNLINASPGVVTRTLRMIDIDGPGPTAPVAADGSGTNPYYKQGIDADGNGSDDLFERPYRPAKVDMLVGTEAGPDIRIDEGVSAQKTFLNNFSAKLLQNFPAAGAGIRARISRIDIYAPPYIAIGGAWTRYGIATVKVTARIYKIVGTTETILAERMIKAVLNETPYPGPFGPLHSCDTLDFNGDFKVHWGPSSSTDASIVTNNHAKIPVGLARDVPASVRRDRLMYYNNLPTFALYKAKIETQSGGLEIEDPWYRFLGKTSVTGPTLCGAPVAGTNQPCPFVWDTVSDLGNEQIAEHNGGTDGTHSNVFHNFDLVGCPEMEYGTWKTIATSGDSDVHYYVWDNGTSFSENGSGAVDTFRNITDNRSGLFFFDTTDKNSPRDDDGNNILDNGTPKITIQGGTWGTRGFLYVNAVDFQTKGVAGRAATYNAPGEPYVDVDDNGRYDLGEPYINLSYPADLTTEFRGSVADTCATCPDGGVLKRNIKGPPIVDEAAIWGVFYNSGQFDATGNAKYYGSVVAKSGVGSSSPAAGTPDIYWDESLITNWPPPGWNLPRVVISRWETDM